MNYWALQRNKKNKLVLLTMNEPVKYSYVRIPLTEEQARKTIKFSKDWKLVSKLNYEELELKKGDEKYDVLLKRFFEIVKEHKNELETPLNKKFVTDVDGTGKLVRSKDRKTIYIARRLNKKTGKIRNITEVNAVCISDFDRDLFFKDCREIYGLLPEGSIYKLTPLLNEEKFKVWTSFMDREYKNQLERFEKRKLKNKKN